MKFMLLIYSNPANWEPVGESPHGEALSEAERRQFAAAHTALQAELTESGERIGGAGLAVPAEATTVRSHDGELEATDGPFAETKEHLAGFYLVECASRERALEIAARLPDARLTAVEVRQVVEATSVGL